MDIKEIVKKNNLKKKIEKESEGIFKVQDLMKEVEKIIKIEFDKIREDLGEKIVSGAELEVEKAILGANSTFKEVKTRIESEISDYIANRKIEIKGEDGKDYILTEEDMAKIAGKIAVPVVEKVIEKTEIIREQPIVKTEIIKTETIKETAPKETGNEIVKKINDAEEKIYIEKINGLEETISDIKKNIKERLRSKGYLHGGGLSRVSTDGTSITGDGTPSNPLTAPGSTTDEKVKYDVNDPVAGYVADKFVAGTGITLSEGTGADENKLKITNSGVVTETDPLSIHNDLMTRVGDMIYENNLTFDTYTSNTATYLGFDYAASPIVVSENGIVSSAIITLNTFGSVAGNVYAKIYNWDATNKIPTGSALSTSDVVDASTVTGDTTFTFTGANKILLNSTSDYCLALYYDGVDFLVYRIGNTGLRDGPGYRATSSDGSTWTTTSGSLHFTLYGIKPDRLPIGTTGQVIKVAGGKPTWADETDPLSLHLDQTTPQAFTGGSLTGTGMLEVKNGVLGKGVKITVSETAPANPQIGDLWVDLTE